MTPGFAVKNARGDILIRTVSDTERAAMVNWLVTELSGWSDAKIKFVFYALATKLGAIVIRVEVREAQ